MASLIVAVTVGITMLTRDKSQPGPPVAFIKALGPQAWLSVRWDLYPPLTLPTMPEQPCWPRVSRIHAFCLPYRDDVPHNADCLAVLANAANHAKRERCVTLKESQTYLEIQCGEGEVVYRYDQQQGRFQLWEAGQLSQEININAHGYISKRLDNRYLNDFGVTEYHRYQDEQGKKVVVQAWRETANKGSWWARNIEQLNLWLSAAGSTKTPREYRFTVLERDQAGYPLAWINEQGHTSSVASCNSRELDLQRRGTPLRIFNK